MVTKPTYTEINIALTMAHKGLRLGSSIDEQYEARKAVRLVMEKFVFGDLMKPPKPDAKDNSVSPEKEEIQEARACAGISQTVASELIYSKLRTWQDWEAGKAKMHAGLWELFLLKIEDRKRLQGG